MAPALRIGDLLARSGDLQALARAAERLKRLEHHLLAAVPPALARASRVTNIRGGTVVISADNAAVAAKLRQLAPRLLLHLRNWEGQVTGIRVHVQVKANRIKAEDDFTARGLPPEAVEDFARLARRLPPSGLRSALTRLSSRARKRRADP